MPQVRAEPLIGIVVTVACSRIAPPVAQAPAFVLRQLAPKVWAAIADIHGASGNSGLVIGDDSVLVIDTLGNADVARQLLAESISSQTCC